MSRLVSVRNYSSALAVLLSLFAAPTFAALDLSSITGAFDGAGVITGILAIGVIMMGVVVARWAVKKLVAFVR